jgi:exodeoxyribonuclease V
MNRRGIPATTIHRLLYHPVEDEEEDPKTKKKVKVVRWRMKRASEAAGADLIVLDEVSMVNGKLARDLMSFGRPILVLGDPGQLPPPSCDRGYKGAREPKWMIHFSASSM